MAIHRKGGRFKWNEANVGLFQSKYQSASSIPEEVRKEWVEKSVFNANLLDYLLKFPDLIPSKWKDEYGYVLFPGTIYIDHNGFENVRCLDLREGVFSPWTWLCRDVVIDWLDDGPAPYLLVD